MDSRDTCHEYIWWTSIDKRKRTAEPKKGIFSDGELFTEKSIPFEFDVCHTCQGDGGYVNPSIDSHGIGQDEWDNMEEEERDTYMNGGYDISCKLCSGQKVIPHPSELKHQQQLDDHYEEMHSYQEEQESERRMGC